MNYLLGSALHRALSGAILLFMLGFYFFAFNSYKSAQPSEEQTVERTKQFGTFGTERVNPSDPYARYGSGDSFYDPHARVHDDVVRDSSDYGGGDWGD